MGASLCFQYIKQIDKLAKYFVLLIRLGKIKGQGNKTNKNTEQLNILHVMVS